MKSQRPLFFPTRTVRDVTADFAAASNQLRPGELVKDEFFTLFEAVGALEVRKNIRKAVFHLVLSSCLGRRKTRCICSVQPQRS